jgi:putative ABC transport system substrate-binding protein
VIGYLNNRSRETDTPFLAAFHRGLNLRVLATDLVDHRVTVMAATSAPAALAAKAATSAIPIVFTTGADPVELGLVDSLSRPSGNATGVNIYLSHVGAKRLELLRELVPNAAIIGMLVNPNFPDAESQSKDVKEAAHTLGQQVHIVNANSEGDFNQAFATFIEMKADALLISLDGFFFSRREQLVTLAARHKIPAIYFSREFVLVGGLMSYGSDIANSYRQAGIYAGRILKGAKPGDLPVVQPTKFDLVINLKTAKALGLTVPMIMQMTADEVIE